MECTKSIDFAFGASFSKLTTINTGEKPMYTINTNDETIYVETSGSVSLDDRKAMVSTLAEMTCSRPGRTILIDHTNALIKGTLDEADKFARYLLDIDIWRNADAIYVMVEDRTQTRMMVDVPAMISMNNNKCIRVCLDLPEVVFKSGITNWPSNAFH